MPSYTTGQCPGSVLRPLLYSIASAVYLDAAKDVCLLWVATIRITASVAMQASLALQFQAHLINSEEAASFLDEHVKLKIYPSSGSTCRPLG